MAGRIGTAQLDRLVAETIKRYDLAPLDPAADPEDGYLSVDPRHATLHDEDVHFAGTMRFEAELDIADALDLNQALGLTAPRCRRPSGATETLDVRRSKALGGLARTQTALDLAGAARETDRATAADCAGSRAPRPLRRHPRWPGDGVGPTGRLEEGQRLVLLDQVKTWCGDSRTKVTIKPVIDVTPSRRAPGYEIPDRIREKVILRDRTCVFPWCTRPARGCDVERVIEYDLDAEAEGRPEPGPTGTSNLGALCQYRRRFKTSPSGTTAWGHARTLRVDQPARCTATDEIALAPRPSSRRTEDDPAPHPAAAASGGVVVVLAPASSISPRQQRSRPHLPRTGWQGR